MLLPLVLLLAVGCSGTAPEPELPSVQGPGHPTIVILDRGAAYETHARTLQAVGRAEGIFVTTLVDPDPHPVAVFADPEGDGTLAQTGLVDVTVTTTATEGWIFARDGAPATYQPPVARDVLVQAASAYFGQDLGRSLPWRAVVVLAGEGFDGFTDALERALGPEDIHVVSWSPGDPVPVAVPGATGGGLDPTTVTAATTGWIFAESGRTPLYQPDAPLPEVLAGAGRWFGVELAMPEPVARKRPAASAPTAPAERQGMDRYRGRGGIPTLSGGRGGSR